MKLDSALENCNTVCKLKSLLVKKTDVKFSFWGKRLVTIEGYEGSLPLARFVWRVEYIAPSDDKFSLLNRYRGNFIAAKINKLYKKSDEITKDCSFITRIFIFIGSYFDRARFQWFRSVIPLKYTFEAPYAWYEMLYVPEKH